MADDLAAENDRLKRELAELQNRAKQEKADLEGKVNKERAMGKAYSEQVKSKADELESMRGQMVRLTRQLDDAVSVRDQFEAEFQSLERKVHEGESGASTGMLSSKGSKGISFSGEKKEEQALDRSSQVSTKLMRVVEQWMNTKDLEQALLRGAGINDMAFSTLVQVLDSCKSLQMLDLGQNQITMDSCSDICRLITTAPSLSFISIAENLFSLRSVGYFMTAVMERQNKKRLTPLEVLDVQGNEGFIAALHAAPPESLVKQVGGLLAGRLPPKGDVLIAQVMRELWRFLHYTGHPQVTNTNPDEVTFQAIDKMTLRKMENALTKILLMSEETESMSAANEVGGGAGKLVHANMALAITFMEQAETDGDAVFNQTATKTADAPPGSKGDSGSVSLPPIDQRSAMAIDNAPGAAQRKSAGPGASASASKMEATQRPSRAELRDPFADLKTAFEPPKEKLKTFNLKQIVTKNHTVLMNMLERLLETTEIDARDVETEQTLLEYACQNGNMGLAKLCYRRGANLSARTKKGYTCFNIVTKARDYRLMEFLHTYGVKVNHQDQFGTTALHLAAANNDVDAVCRLIEWGADVNLYDFRKRTPLHTAARKGKYEVTMLLLELGADMNAKDEKEYTAVAHAEAKNHFKLMDRLVDLGGKGHGLSTKTDVISKSKSAKSLGQVTVTAQMLKSSSLGRIGKVAVKGLPGQLSPKMLK